MNLKALHKQSIYNAGSLKSEHLCGCFHCMQTFKGSEVNEFTDRGQTILCPKCGIDSVLTESSGAPMTREFLEQMNAKWFQGTKHSATSA